MSRFAHAGIARLITTALAFGVVAGAAVLWLAAAGWAPVLDDAVNVLPESARIQNGTLLWPERSGRLLAANRFLSLEVILAVPPGESASADIVLEARQNSVVFRSLLGALRVPYFRALDLPLDRKTVSPAWGAWRAPVLFLLVPGIAFILLPIWALLALPYALLALPIGAVFRRDLNFRRAWKLCVAAQLPGSVLMSFAIALYASGQVSILFIPVMLVAHFIPTAAYLLISPILVPKRLPSTDARRRNPFNRGEEPKSRARNPFAGSES